MKKLLLVIDFDETLTKFHTFFEKLIEAQYWPIKYAYDRGTDRLAENVKAGVAAFFRSLIAEEGVTLLVASYNDDKRVLIEHLRACGLTNHEISELYIASRPMEFEGNPYYVSDRPADGIVGNDERYAQFRDRLIDVARAEGGKEVMVERLAEKTGESYDVMLFADNCYQDKAEILAYDKIPVEKDSRAYLNVETSREYTGHLDYILAYVLNFLYGSEAQGENRMQLRKLLNIDGALQLGPNDRPANPEAVRALHELMRAIKPEVLAKRERLHAERIASFRANLVTKISGLFREDGGNVVLGKAENALLRRRPLSEAEGSPRKQCIHLINEYVRKDVVKDNVPLGNRKHGAVLDIDAVTGELQCLERFEKLLNLLDGVRRRSDGANACPSYDAVANALKGALEREQDQKLVREETRPVTSASASWKV